MTFFIDYNGEERRTNTWYPYPFIVYSPKPWAGIPTHGEFYRLRRLLADGSIDCWPCFGRRSAEPVAWMVIDDLGWYEI
jgi:hypothetical protein